MSRAPHPKVKAVKLTRPNPNTSLQKSCYRQKVTREVGPADTAPVGKQQQSEQPTVNQNGQQKQAEDGAGRGEADRL